MVFPPKLNLMFGTNKTMEKQMVRPLNTLNKYMKGLDDRSRKNKRGKQREFLVSVMKLARGKLPHQQFVSSPPWHEGLPLKAAGGISNRPN
jgi:hypothetical protein